MELKPSDAYKDFFDPDELYETTIYPESHLTDWSVAAIDAVEYFGNQPVMVFGFIVMIILTYTII